MIDVFKYLIYDLLHFELIQEKYYIIVKSCEIIAAARKNRNHQLKTTYILISVI